MEKDLLIKPDGGIVEVCPNNGTDYSLEELQNFVGGYVQICRGADCIFVCNEEGKLKGLPVNYAATTTAHRTKALALGDFFVGNVLLTVGERVK